MKFINILRILSLSKATLFKETNCPNFFDNTWDVMDPWPKNCKVYKTSNPCNRFELSQDVPPKILSCDIAEMCMAVMATPECLEFYPASNDDELKNCSVWNDGCNTCSVRDGKI